MADSSVAVTAGTGTAIDTRTEATNGHHRQVVILGDPSTNAGVAPVDATAGLKVDLGADNDVVVSATNLDIRDLTNTDVVTAELSATDNAVLDAIESDTTNIAGDTTSIDAKIPALGQALAAASVPVILPAATITTLTPPAAITGFATSAKQDTIIGHVDGIETLLGTIDTDTGNIATEVAGLLTDTELRATPVPVSGTVTANLSATDNAVLDDIALDTEAIKTSLAGTLTVTGGGGGVEYTEGDTDATIVGSAIMFESNTGTNTISAVSNTTPLPISDAGGTLTVDGTVAVTNAGITTIAGAVSGTEMQVDVLTMPTTAVTGTFWQATQPVSLASAPTTTVTATDLDIRNLVNTDVVTAELSAVDNAVLDTIAAKDFATQTTLAAMNAKMVTGTDIGDVTINNASGASAVNIQDGGNTITVDGTVSANATLSAETTKVIGTVNIASAQTLATVTTVGAVTAITNALPAGTNAIGKLSANSGVDIGDVDVTSISAGTNLIGDVSLQPRTGNGCTLFRSIDLDETEEEIKASAGNLYGYYFANTTASARYIKLYNATAANTTVGTTTPIATFYLPPTSAGHIALDFPISFATALSAAATTGVADADTGAPGASDVLFMAWYK